ncbi:MAG TPA: saccharopine dehydrogenase C-terminal domain-containing protein [Chitinophagaceae bacterium]|jgi:saccharopine dehydrogenase (NADP+, L-glutamate forming)|nr:saccharopine dehydrogenase C-terminal domain-containing protein [Chitinophagaceae bacterium]
MMQTILLFGAGKSATVLIDYLLHEAENNDWEVIVADNDAALAQSKVGHSPRGRAVSFDIHQDLQRHQYIQQADIVISLLPPSLHFLVAKDCVRFSKNLLTASYVDNAIRELANDITDRNLLFLCEMGLDPGIDHMSAMQVINRVRADAGEIIAFRSHCGGLVAPESDDNPWHYKISWNPRNIVLAGKAGAHYREKGVEKRMGYEELFENGRHLQVPGLGELSWYPNRDSLSYAPLYGLENTATFIRTTLRHADFMSGWQKIIALKLTDETPLYETNGRSLQQLFQEHLDRYGFEAVYRLPETDLLHRQLTCLGLYDATTFVNKGLCSAADILQVALEKKLALHPADKDMIVMLHEIEYRSSGQTFLSTSSLLVKGENSLHTAMAKTVGLPLGIAAKLILNGSLRLTGLHIPTNPIVYEPVLKALADFGIRFQEDIKIIS